MNKGKQVMQVNPKFRLNLKRSDLFIHSLIHSKCGEQGRGITVKMLRGEDGDTELGPSKNSVP